MDVTERVKLLSDEELFVMLKENNATYGPILPSTRSLYEIALIRVLSGNSEPLNTSDREASQNAEPAAPATAKKSRAGRSSVAPTPKKASPEPKPNVPAARHSFTRYLTGEAEQKQTYDSSSTYDGVYNEDSEGDLTDGLPSSTLGGSSRVGQYSTIPNLPLYTSAYKYTEQKRGTNESNASYADGPEERSPPISMVGLIGIALLIIAVVLGYILHTPDPYAELEMEAEKLVGKMAGKDDVVAD